MSICYIDAFSGLAGDMLLGALIDTGADGGADRATVVPAINKALSALVPEAAISWERVKRAGITATKFGVAAPETSKHRHLPGILKMIAAVDIPQPARDRAVRIFEVLAEAESTVHGVPIEKVHFHEVGAVDSICDIVGISLALELLGVTRLCCSAINTGSGTVMTEHGLLPVPAPATARLLLNKPLYARGPAMELTTPTGAAVVAALADTFGTMPAMTINAIGYGAGDRDFKEHANVVRVMLGEPSGAAESTTVSVIEANLDDCSPQVVAYAAERLLAAGALDALLIPAQMKKGRPAVILQVIAAPDKREELAAILFRETTTLGVRFHEAQRRVLPREWKTVETPHGPIRIKVTPEGFAPEYEDARKLAAETGVPLKQILTEAVSAYLKQ